MLDTKLTLNNLASKKSFTKGLSALLVASCLFGTAVSAKQNDDNWFQRSDLMLPRQMSTSVLINGFRYVLMPTDQPGIEIRLDTDAEQAFVFNSSPETEEELITTITSIAEALKLPTNEDNLDSSSLVIVGDFNVSKVKREVVKLFSTTDIVDLSSMNKQHNVQSNAQLDILNTASQVEARPEVVSISVLSPFDADDSKKSRREKLTRDIARSVLVERLETALETSQLAVSSIETKELELFDHQLMTSTTMTLTSEQDVEAGFKVLKNTLTNLVSAGVSRKEFEQHAAKIRQQLVTNQPSVSQQADEIVSAVKHHKVYVQPSDVLMLFDFHMAHLNSGDVTAALQSVWNEHNSVMITKGNSEKQNLGLNLSALK
ncbi:hypothetical protein L4C33_21100 [Vibrio makurazakiensis]|uniref:hypothetical protein n=1 Tax=Vibrio makurazakiensis TaxID=2910250 RepID=UPI003D104DF1